MPGYAGVPNGKDGRLDQGEYERKAVGLAQQVLTLSRNTLLVNLRHLDAALSQFRLAPWRQGNIATNGREMFFDPMHVLKQYRNEKEAPVRNYLHMVFHCVFRRNFVGCWWTASSGTLPGT